MDVLSLDAIGENSSDRENSNNENSHNSNTGNYTKLAPREWQKDFSFFSSAAKRKSFAIKMKNVNNCDCVETKIIMKAADSSEQKEHIAEQVLQKLKTPIFKMKPASKEKNVRKSDRHSPGSFMQEDTLSEFPNSDQSQIEIENKVSLVDEKFEKREIITPAKEIVELVDSHSHLEIDAQSTPNSQSIFPVPYTAMYSASKDSDAQSGISSLPETIKIETKIEGYQPCSLEIIPDERIHSCEFCGRTYASKYMRNRHRKTHTHPRTHQCACCPLAFFRACDLQRHMRIHTGEKNEVCEMCGAEFAQISDLNRHRMIHTGERPFKCEFCEAAFSRSGNLNQHRRTHTGERPYKCDQCDAAFSQGGLLTSHMRKHTGDIKHICFECGAAFTQGGDLTKHKRIHSGERPFKCEECGKSFMQSGHLMQHRRTHSNEKPFVCTECGEHYKQASHLSKHLKRTGHVSMSKRKN